MTPIDPMEEPWHCPYCGSVVEDASMIDDFHCLLLCEVCHIKTSVTRVEEED